MTKFTPVSHLHVVPREPRLVEYNASAAGRIGCTVLNKSKLSDRQMSRPRFRKTECIRMHDIRKNASRQFAHNDKEIVSNVVNQFSNDTSPDTTGSAGAANEITIQKDRNVTGSRVKWGLVSSTAMVVAQTLGFL